MWDDVVIGKGEFRVTTITCYNSKENTVSISDNSLFFRVTGLIFGCGMTIYKNTKEGQALIKLLTTPNDVKIKAYLDKQLVKRLPVDKILALVNMMKEDAYRAGMVAKQEELKKVLGIFESY